MSEQVIDVLACPSCAHIIKTAKTVGKPGTTLITCPACKKPSTLFSFLAKFSDESEEKPINVHESDLSGSWTDDVFSGLKVTVASILLLISCLLILGGIANSVQAGSSFGSASLDDLFKATKRIEGLLQLLLAGKLLMWSCKTIKKATG